MKIVKKYGYQGYFPIEALGDGDPYKKVQNIYRNVSENML